MAICIFLFCEFFCHCLREGVVLQPQDLGDGGHHRIGVGVSVHFYHGFLGAKECGGTPGVKA